MSEIEQLESLSNAALRDKCLQYGLPNVPVTDSSRRVLIKKLAAILGDPSGGKKVNRRETIHSTKPMTPTKNVISSSSGAVPEERSTPSRSSRRTIAVPISLEEKEEKKLQEKANPPLISERRRSASQKTFTETEEAVSKTTSIAERRRSVRGDSQPKVAVQTKISSNKPQQTIAEEEEKEIRQKPPQVGKRSSVVRESAPVASSRKTTASLEVDSLVILDSEDEEDEDLAVVAERVEKQIKSHIPTAIKGNSRPPSLSRTSIYSTYTSSAPAASVEPIEEETPSYKQTYSGAGLSYGTSKVGSGSLYTTASQRSTYSAFSSSQPSRTSTEYVSSFYNAKDSPSLAPSLGSSALAPSLGSSSLYKTAASPYTSTLQNRPLAKLRPSTFTNEQSDNDLELDKNDTPYLSQFVQKLERLKAENLQSSKLTLSSRYRSSIGNDRYGKYSENGLFKQFWLDLNRKYHITFYFKIVTVFVLIVFFYIMFFY